MKKKQGQMAGTVLITGGAGFIGSHVADELLRQGYRVRALDSLSPQVHGEDAQRPEYLDPEVELVRGDVRDRPTVRRALRGVDAVIHLAAAVGVGQSMYRMEHYTSTNQLGTAVLLEELTEQPVERLVVASSMSVYGEGLYRTSNGQPVEDVERRPAQLENGVWEPIGPGDEALTPVATPESKPPSLSSIYALSKYDQERMCLIAGEVYDIPTVALRLFNVYGRRQALSNPYTGVLAIFASRLLNDRPPLIFEDGHQRRDFVSVLDVARAFRMTLEVETAERVFNIGSGESHSVRQIARRLGRTLGVELEPRITGQYRAGDIRHCFADITRARTDLRFEPRISLEEGLEDLAGWLEGRQATDHVERASAELAERGLTV